MVMDGAGYFAVAGLFITTAILIAALSGIASAQTIYTGPGTYQTYGNQTYSPSGVQQTYGNQTYTPGGTYQTYGNQTYGPNNSTFSTYGNTTYGVTGPRHKVMGTRRTSTGQMVNPMFARPMALKPPVTEPYKIGLFL
jgi:hypothetical protein